MNKNLLIVFIITLQVILWGCSNNNEEPIFETTLQMSVRSSSLKINEKEAISIADRFLNKKSTRFGSPVYPSSEYIISDVKTRFSSDSDTIAYIFNYPNDEGFAIVAAYRIENPILAFSKRGKFDIENEIVKKYFINNLTLYLESANKRESINVNEGYLDGCAVVQVDSTLSISQWNPWNKYVIKEHPNCPVGCVAVASALAICQTQDSIVYHNSTYQTRQIYEYLTYGTSSTIKGSKHNISSYAQAVDSMAKLMYWIGKDVHMKYKEDESSAPSDSAFLLCKSINLYTPTSFEGYTTDSLPFLVTYLKQGFIVYLRGTETSGKGGHAWIADGCMYCYKDPNKKTGIKDIYLHCNWGWGGIGNGYYIGNIFKIDNPFGNGKINFEVQNYFVLGQKTSGLPLIPIEI
ncbi:MAG: C10 family peptidase [Muribaculaceae bacterium]|nr:C10 family peptidase [Muribaculaceae bacterium]